MTGPLVRALSPALLTPLVLLAPFTASLATGQTLTVTEPLVGGTAVFAPFDDLGGLRLLDSVDVAIDVIVDVTTSPIANDDPTAPTTIDIEQDLLLDWAPDDPAYHLEPTDNGAATATINTLVTIDADDSAIGAASHLLPTFSYTESTYDFNETYGVRLLTAVTAQLVSVVDGAGNISPVGTLLTTSGTATVTYRYTRVPEPGGVALTATLPLLARRRQRR